MTILRFPVQATESLRSADVRSRAFEPHDLAVPRILAPTVPPATVPDLTVLVPAFNEQNRLPGTLAGLVEFLDDWGPDWRILVCDDGSTDRTARVADDFGPRCGTLSLVRNRGKGAAVRYGMLAARGHVLAFTDADLPYDLAALRRGYEAIRGGDCDVVYGARDLDGAEHVARRRLLRTIATSVFRGVVRTLVSKDVTDTQCGLKLFSADAARAVFSRLTLDGFAFDAEAVFVARRLRLRHERIPVRLINEYSSTLSLRRHALPMFLDVLRIRQRARQGAYDRPLAEFGTAGLAASAAPAPRPATGLSVAADLPGAADVARLSEPDRTFVPRAA